MPRLIRYCRYTTMDNYLAVSAMSTNSPAAVESILAAIRDCSCHVVEARGALLGNKNVLLLMLAGSWNSIAKLETSLTRVADQNALKIIVERTEHATVKTALLPYAVEIVAEQNSEALFSIFSFFGKRGAVVSDLNAHSYKSQRNETAMTQIQLAVDIPADSSIANMRGEFMDFCDQINVDAILEPAK